MYVRQGHHSPSLPFITALRRSFPTPQPDIHCKALCLQTSFVMCYVMAILFRISLFFGKNRQIEHSNFNGKYTTLFCKRVLKTWEKEKGIVGVNVTKRESFNLNRSLDYNMYILTIVWYCFLTSFFIDILSVFITWRSPLCLRSKAKESTRY